MIRDTRLLIRLLIVLTVLTVGAAIVGLLRSVPGFSLTMPWAAGNNSEVLPPPPHYEAIAQLLDKQMTREARARIESAMSQADDSLQYYRYQALLTRYYFMTMQADSMRQATERLHRFLAAQPSADDNPILIELAIHEQRQRGVYAVKMSGQMDSALAHYERAMQLLDRLPGHTDHRLVMLTNLADVCKQMGRYDRCVDYYHKAIDLSDSVGVDTLTNIVIHLGIATAHTAMGNFEYSDHWWQLADSLRPLMQRGDLFQLLNNRGNDYFLQAKYAESLKCFAALDSLCDSHDDMMWERLFCHVNLSHVYIKMGEREKAMQLIDEAEHFFTAQRQPIALYYLTTQRMEQAVLDGHTDEALKLHEASGLPAGMIPEQIILRQQVLMMLYRKAGQWQQYAKAMTTYQYLQDSLISDKQRMQFAVELLRHDHKRNMLDKQRQIEEKELSFRWAVALLVAAAIVIILLSYIGLLYRREQQLREQAMHSRIAGLRMANVRNRITPHFMSNALAHEMLAQMDGKQADLDSLVELLHRGIEMSGTEQTTLRDELTFIQFYCDVEGRSIGPDFVYNTQLAADVDPDRVVLPAMFVQILVENALKHGLKPKPRSAGKQRTVTVRATRRDNGTLVEVIDNGVGLPAEWQRTDHTGLKVVRQTMQLLNEQNSRQITFELANYTSDDGQKGCRAALFLPDDYSYTLTDKTNILETKE